MATTSPRSFIIGIYISVILLCCINTFRSGVMNGIGEGMDDFVIHAPHDEKSVVTDSLNGRRLKGEHVQRKRRRHNGKQIRRKPKKSHNIHIETFVISLDKNGYDTFLYRNRKTDLVRSSSKEKKKKNPAPLWIPGINGLDQSTLNTWSQISSLSPPLESSLYTSRNKTVPSPHHIGCYLAHYHLLRQLENGHYWDDEEESLNVGGAYLIFENDAQCVRNVEKRVEDLVKSLPDNWDMAFIGGKIYQEFDGIVNDDDIPEEERPNLTSVSSEEEAKIVVSKEQPMFNRSKACLGHYGRAVSPLSPSHTRILSSKEQPYWILKKASDTFSYLVNPKRISNVMDVIRDPDSYVPIDIKWMGAMERGDLNVYMSTEALCSQDEEDEEFLLNNKEERGLKWSGWNRMVPGIVGVESWYGEILFEECIGKY